MALSYYDRGFVFVNGALLGESSGGSIEYQGDPVIVATLTKDFAGITPVPKSARVSVDSFVPAKGFDYDAIKAYLSSESVTVKLQMGGSGVKMQADGYVMPPSITFSATDSTKLSFAIICEAQPFE